MSALAADCLADTRQDNTYSWVVERATRDPLLTPTNLGKLVRLLDILARAERPLNVGAAAEAMGMHINPAIHFISKMAIAGYITKTRNNREVILGIPERRP